MLKNGNFFRYLILPSAYAIMPLGKRYYHDHD